MEVATGTAPLALHRQLCPPPRSGTKLWPTVADFCGPWLFFSCAGERSLWWHVPAKGRGLSMAVARGAAFCICLLGSSCRQRKPIGIMVMLNGKRRFFWTRKGLFMYHNPLFNAVNPLKAASSLLCAARSIQVTAAAQHGFCSTVEEWGKFWKKSQLAKKNQHFSVLYWYPSSRLASTECWNSCELVIMNYSRRSVQLSLPKAWEIKRC